MLNLMVLWRILLEPCPNYKSTYFNHGCEVPYCLPRTCPNLWLYHISTWFTCIAYYWWWTNLHSIGLLKVESAWLDASRYVISITNYSNDIWTGQESKSSRKIYTCITCKIYMIFLFPPTLANFLAHLFVYTPLLATTKIGIIHHHYLIDVIGSPLLTLLASTH